MTTLQTPLTLATTATASATLAAGKHTPVDATSGAKTMTLPTPATVGARLRVEKVDASANAVSVTGTIRGATSTVTLAGRYELLEFWAESLTSWRPSGGTGGGTGGGGTVADATTTTKGVVQLAGDLAGTAAAPTVPGLAGKLAAASNLSDVASAATARTNLGLATVATSGSYTDLINKPTIPAAYTDEQAQDAVAAAIAAGTQTGISVSYNDAANSLSFTATGTTSPDATTTTKGLVQLAGDLAGTAAAPTVPGLAGKLTAASNLSDLASPATARANLSVPLASPNGGVKFRDDISAYNINGDSLRAWRFAYAKAKNGEGRAVIGCYGDSTTQGFRGTLPQYQNSWVAHMRSLIEARTGVTTGTGFVTANNIGQDAGENRITFTGSWAAAGYGAVMTNTDYLSSTGGTFTIGPITCDRIRIYYLKYSGGGTATVTVDGSAVASINTNNASFDVGFTDYTMTQGSHTLVLTAPTGASFDLFGWEAALNGTATGVRVDNLGLNGRKADELPVVSGTSGGPQIASKANWETLAPSLVTVMFGANDLGAGGPTPAAWQATMTGIVQKAQAVGASVILMPNMPVSAASYDPNGYYSQFVAATYAIADAQNCIVLDISKQWKDYTTSNAAGLMFDGQHPNNRGYWAFGNFVTTALLNVAVV